MVTVLEGKSASVAAAAASDVDDEEEEEDDLDNFPFFALRRSFISSGSLLSRGGGRTTSEGPE